MDNADAADRRAQVEASEVGGRVHASGALTVLRSALARTRTIPVVLLVLFSIGRAGWAEGEGPKSIQPRTLRQLGAAALMPDRSPSSAEGAGGIRRLRRELSHLRTAIRALARDRSSAATGRARDHSARTRQAAGGLLAGAPTQRGAARLSRGAKHPSVASGSRQRESVDAPQRLDDLLRQVDETIANPGRKPEEIAAAVGAIDSALAGPLGSSGPTLHFQITPPSEAP